MHFNLSHFRLVDHIKSSRNMVNEFSIHRINMTSDLLLQTIWNMKWDSKK